MMLFGLTFAPAVFQSLINDVLHYFLNQFVVVYWDGILIFFPSFTEHKLLQKHVRLVLQKLLRNCLFVKAENCEFHIPSVTFVGYVIESRQVKLDPKKTQAVAE